MSTDPFELKKYSKAHPKRILFSLQSRWSEKVAMSGFDRYCLPEKNVATSVVLPQVDWANTEVTPLQMQHLLYAISDTEHLSNTVVVEVGCYRGVTTRCLSNSTSRKYIAVDPYIGYGGSDKDYGIFKNNIIGSFSIFHERKTSGEAAKSWQHGPISLVFIDAVHDYVNAAFDIEVWSSLLAPGGIIALHDTDQLCFAGTRKATYELAQRSNFVAHVENLTLLQPQ